MILFNTPYVPEISRKYALEAMDNEHQQGDGPFTKKASALLSQLVGGGRVLLTPSCTHALEMASMLMNLGPGDEVIIPSYNFTSAATSVTKFGAKPVFVDVDSRTKCIDLDRAREAISPRTKAISWVNYAGMSPNIEFLQYLSNEFNLFLVEDNAHGLGGTYKGKPLGSFGHFATQSFHATKNVQCGEGGALVINDFKFIERAEIIREKGTDRTQFLRGEVQKYQWVDLGSSYLLAETLAAILLGQLESFEKLQSQRIGYWQKYLASFSDFSRSDVLDINLTSKENTNVAHIFFVEVSSIETKNRLIQHFSHFGVPLNSHYQSLHSSKAALSLQTRGSGEFFNSSFASSNLLRIPIWTYMPDEIVERVCEAIHQLGLIQATL